MQLFLISGLSGSGKSVALKVLEDSGYYCVDNMPAELLPALMDNLRQAGKTRVAVSIDVRSGGGVQQLPHYIEQLKQYGLDVHLLFLDAQTDTLVKRFSETRRRHPLSDDKLTLPECVQRERDLLAEIGHIGHHIDTSELGANALRAWVKDFIHVDRARLTLLFQSFGFKNGIPLDADMVFDVRCLPNPHYDPVLRPSERTRRAPVIQFLDETHPHGAKDVRVTSAPSSKTGCPASSPTTAATSPSPSAAPADNTARCISRKNWRAIFQNATASAAAPPRTPATSIN
jgi:UPF0042 nucleotide-binding protein